ncbi:MAG: beta-lactamase family protein [Anaerolineales bacterium]|nr:MAG: beta-lactamase family protein [Anaerolineales bacterium]
MNIVTSEEVGLSSTRLEHLRTAAQGYVDRGELAGLITLVARHGQVAHLECHGLMDIEADKPMQPNTIFRIYSMTKPIACFALMMLVEEGLIALNEPVAKFIPEFKELKVFVRTTETGVELADVEREMTIWHLLTHTSGLSYDAVISTPVEEMYREAELFDELRVLQVSLQDMIRILIELPLGFQPGSEFRYSVAHDVIGYLVSLVSDSPFDTFLEERIFSPLGMVDTGFYVPREKLDRFAAMYSAPGDDGIRLLDAPATSPFSRPDRVPSGGVGLVSTASDYFRFAQMLLNGGELEGVRLLSRETVLMMTTNQLPDEQVPIFSWSGMGYGLGLGVHVGPDRTRDLGSRGTFLWLGHAGTNFWVDPNEALIGLIMPQALHYHDYLGPLRELTNQAIVD